MSKMIEVVWYEGSEQADILLPDTAENWELPDEPEELDELVRQSLATTDPFLELYAVEIWEHLDWEGQHTFTETAKRLDGKRWLQLQVMWKELRPADMELNIVAAIPLKCLPIVGLRIADYPEANTRVLYALMQNGELISEEAFNRHFGRTIRKYLSDLSDQINATLLYVGTLMEAPRVPTELTVASELQVESVQEDILEGILKPHIVLSGGRSVL